MKIGELNVITTVQSGDRFVFDIETMEERVMSEFKVDDRVVISDDGCSSLYGEWARTGVVIAVGPHLCAVRTPTGEYIMRPEALKHSGFTKDDLQTGDVVVTRNDQKYMVLGDTLSREETWTGLSSYNSNLTADFSRAFDIMKVYRRGKFAGTFKGNINCSIHDEYKVYERREVKKMTTKQVEEALGYPVEIII